MALDLFHQGIERGHKRAAQEAGRLDKKLTVYLVVNRKRNALRPTDNGLHRDKARGCREIHRDWPTKSLSKVYSQLAVKQKIFLFAYINHFLSLNPPFFGKKNRCFQ